MRTYILPTISWHDSTDTIQGSPDKTLQLLMYIQLLNSITDRSSSCELSYPAYSAGSCRCSSWWALVLAAVRSSTVAGSGAGYCTASHSHPSYGSRQGSSTATQPRSSWWIETQPWPGWGRLVQWQHLTKIRSELSWVCGAGETRRTSHGWYHIIKRRGHNYWVPGPWIWFTAAAASLLVEELRFCATSKRFRENSAQQWLQIVSLYLLLQYKPGCTRGSSSRVIRQEQLMSERWTKGWIKHRLRCWGSCMWWSEIWRYWVKSLKLKYNKTYYIQFNSYTTNVRTYQAQGVILGSKETNEADHEDLKSRIECEHKCHTTRFYELKRHNYNWTTRMTITIAIGVICDYLFDYLCDCLCDCGMWLSYANIIRNCLCDCDMLLLCVDIICDCHIWLWHVVVTHEILWYVPRLRSRCREQHIRWWGYPHNLPFHHLHPRGTWQGEQSQRSCRALPWRSEWWPT